MPISAIHFEDNIFFARQIGHIDHEDARAWLKQLMQAAASSPTPIALLMDATEASSVSNRAQQVFVRAAQVPNIQVGAVAASDVTFKQTARVIEMMSSEHMAHIFPTVEEAWDFIIQQLHSAGTA